MALEDIGVANLGLCAKVEPILQLVQRTGMPESRILLSALTIELALSPKSNSAYKAIDAAIADIKAGRGKEVPNHLKDTHYRGAEVLGHKGYLYPHDYKHSWVNQEYMPDDLIGVKYYIPSSAGDEKWLKATYEKLENLKNNS